MKLPILQNFFKSAVAHLGIEELIKSPIHNLIGVSDEAQKALEQIDIHTVFDLAYSEIFKIASYINQVNDDESFIAIAKQIPSYYLDKSVDQSSYEELKELGIKALKGVGDESGKKIKAALNISTIRELALWPVYANAKLIVDEHFGFGLSSLTDVDAPQDLVPKTGGYPVEVVYYNHTVMINAPGVDQKKQQKLESAGRVKFNLDDHDAGFNSPGFGAHLTFSQSWFVQGITLGTLIKAVPLAAGETTKIAVIDWQKKVTGTTAEDVSQTEQLNNSLSQKRAVDEIASATAKEMQSGSSSTSSFGTNYAESAGGWQFFLMSGMGSQMEAGITSAHATATTASEASRDLSSSMHQKINNSTQQNSFSSRNKRASIITEVAEKESETITTRTISNYNHMHALTIQYWQMVQIYRTEVKVEDYKRCIFIPLALFDFTDQRIVTRFRSLLLKYALSSVVTELLLNVSAKVSMQISGIPFWESISIPDDADEQLKKKLALDIAKLKLKEKAYFSALQNQGLIGNYYQETGSWTMNSDFTLVNVKWNNTLKEISIVLVDGQVIKVKKNGVGFAANTLNPDLTNAISVSKIDQITAEFTPGKEDLNQHIEFKFKKYGNDYASLPLKLFISKDKRKVNLLECTQPFQLNDLSDLLNQDSLYYSQQIWLNADPQFLAMQLSSYTYQGKSIMESIDPKPVAVSGNCLGFIWHDQEDKKWLEWVRNNINKNEITAQKVAIPTDGVFAEAVLGRFNCAEKLDLTRFWNWQDSPPPISAPEIAAIQAGNHHASQAPQTGNLDAPIVNIMNPPALPDPTGMQGILQALVTANLFRDMSGISAAAALGNTALTSATQSAIAVGDQVGNNLGKQVDLSKSIFSSLAGIATGAVSPAAKSISAAGAAFNAAKEIDTATGNGSFSPLRNNTPNASAGTTFASLTSNGRGEQGAVLDMITGRNATESLGENKFAATARREIVEQAPEIIVLEDELDSTTFTDVSFLLTGYEVDAYKLSASQIERLDLFVDDYLLKLDYNSPSSPLVITEIIGRASETGTNDYNDKLGKRRANEVALYFVKKGFANTVIPEPKSEGEDNPLEYSFEQENAINRHVEIRYTIIHNKIIPKPPVVPSNTNKASSNWNLDMGVNVSSTLIPLSKKAAIAGTIMFGFLTNTLTKERKQVQIMVVGVDYSSSLFFASADISLKSVNGDFTLDKEVTFDYFDGMFVEVVGFGMGAGLGLSVGGIGLGIPIEAVVPSISIDMAIKVSIGINGMVGFMNVIP